MQSSQILFPPQIFLHLRTKSRQHIVRVHNNVYKSVEETEESTVATCSNTKKKRITKLDGEKKNFHITWCKFNTKPDRHWHNTVVYNMQRGYVAILLSQHKEDLVKQPTLLNKTKKTHINLTVSMNSVNLEK